jgi:hypothetical protein
MLENFLSSCVRYSVQSRHVCHCRTSVPSSCVVGMLCVAPRCIFVQPHPWLGHFGVAYASSASKCSDIDDVRTRVSMFRYASDHLVSFSRASNILADKKFHLPHIVEKQGRHRPCSTASWLTSPNVQQSLHLHLRGSLMETHLSLLSSVSLLSRFELSKLSSPGGAPDALSFQVSKA